MGRFTHCEILYRIPAKCTVLKRNNSLKVWHFYFTSIQKRTAICVCDTIGTLFIVQRVTGSHINNGRKSERTLSGIIVIRVNAAGLSFPDISKYTEVTQTQGSLITWYIVFIRKLSTANLNENWPFSVMSYHCRWVSEL